MTLDDFVLMSLGSRIKWLHGPKGPRGKLSHDKFAKILGTSRQLVIKWEKNETEPRDFLGALAEFSGFPEAAFSLRGAEALVEESAGPRLQRLQVEADTTRGIVRAVLEALAERGIQVPLTEEALGFLATPEPASQAGTP